MCDHAQSVSKWRPLCKVQFTRLFVVVAYDLGVRFRKTLPNLSQKDLQPGCATTARFLLYLVGFVIFSVKIIRTSLVAHN